MRNLSKTLAVLSLFAPASAHALGIGDIKLHSALNQNLNAEIALILSPGEKVSDIKVNLAPPDKFDEAGVPWNYFLSKIKFEPVVRPDGSVVIKLSSREALKEPFLGLLLEVSWPKGSLYREFSVLVDPPEVYEQATIPVVTLPEHSKTTSAYTPSEYTPPREPVVTRPAQKKSRPGYKVTGNYGPTRRNDTLWNIAEKAGRQQKVSVEQMMLAIYRENPTAFFKENINALQSGKTLKIPKREAALKLSRKQALAEFDRHVAAWKNHTDIAPAQTEAVAENVVKDQKVADNQLTLAAPTEASVAENAVITPGQEQSATAAKTADTTRDASKPADAAMGIQAGKGQEGDALQIKVVELQQQLAKMQEILALKDQQLSALQNQGETPPVIQPATQPPVPAAIQSATQPPTSEAVQPKEQTPIVVAQQPPTQPTQESVKSTPASVQPATPVEPVKPRKNPAPAIQPLATAEDEPDLYYIAAGSIGLGVLTVLGWLWWRKRKVDAKTDTESMFAPSSFFKPSEEAAPAAPVKASVLEDSTLYSVDPVGESSFLSEFTPSDFDAFDTDQGEIDPVSEADVYLAYGRYQQAEELMRTAITEQPERDECKLKLLEIFYANENKKAFEEYAEELAAAGKKTDRGFWEKVEEMGQEICPDALLFSSGTNPIPAQDKSDTGHDFVNLNKKSETTAADYKISDEMDFDNASFDELLNDDITSETTKSDISALDFDVSSIGIDESFEHDEGEQKHNESIEFDLSPFTAETKDSDFDRFDQKVSEQPISAAKAVEDKDFESFDFHLDTSAAENAEKFGDIDLTGTKDKENDGFEEALSLDGDFNFDFDLSEPEAGEDSEHMDAAGVFDLTDMDEFETKLDLARAYLDMGDDASAKEIIEEVLVKGSDDQKKMAGQLLSDLS